MRHRRRVAFVVGAVALAACSAGAFDGRGWSDGAATARAAQRPLTRADRAPGIPRGVVSPGRARRLMEHAHEEQALARLMRIGAAVRCGGGRAPEVALTFGAGPGPYPERTAALLRRAHARATFFFVGQRALEFQAAARTA